MAEYLLLIYNDESAAPVRADAGVSSPYQEFMARRAGALRGGAALEGAATATSVRAAVDGGFAVTDGVFVESKEVLGGYYVVEAADLDEALAIAKEVPNTGGVEVRPIRMRS